ncbi:nucleotidyl transferase AbiEii/AbiGii toxin family protein [Effusibacillus lacus]|uniref:Nucleotidyl transferase AbiEii/AbiGii toxin family protein n=1 Tax=Effusibacillus lacus TaxID=1348429 RepID=A0A292YKU8_9BACL|nr:nucleotidyl transferase AbiEii/AbiGii toxin family protein [Effusibacillus lacus]TCS75167.1 nucleotidyltransferase AbiEii toxin of type IV toxin-antitoxin system [Effusibacillus lacus]GAX89115.1 hypothetical protein EFBL_0733 [Effusibacillus lacus]
MNAEKLKMIRKLVIIAMFGDDDLMDMFVLKGGSAIEFAYKIDARASVDVDLSMEEDIPEEKLQEVSNKIERSLIRVFQEEGYVVFDFKFIPKPEKRREGLRDFWGGYAIEFKILPEVHRDILNSDLHKARKMAEVVGPKQGKKLEIDISKYEYCDDTRTVEIDGYTVYVYTPEMLVIEKLRAICQQMPEYPINGRNKHPRPRDFYDIYVLMNNVVGISVPEYDLVKQVFALKEVPIDLLKTIPLYREYHAGDLDSLRDTVPRNKEIEFNLYFDFVVNLVERITGDKLVSQVG